jgi:hypothetical protein
MYCFCRMAITILLHPTLYRYFLVAQTHTIGARSTDNHLQQLRVGRRLHDAIWCHLRRLQGRAEALPQEERVRDLENLRQAHQKGVDYGRVHLPVWLDCESTCTEMRCRECSRRASSNILASVTAAGQCLLASQMWKRLWRERSEHDTPGAWLPRSGKDNSAYSYDSITILNPILR